ncbi:fermentation associated protein [Geosmithia morbida]|uniref:Fermentation associated protein n=1 Tax=Geosmithia morbida TaxID=1094350 RepID=A0A9P4Z3B3_9HYPO|nr:fermentation associated protein [Geosmithia morbida]KAF4126463.1 fermentation associated protein [Geosmithia morbida]
MLLSAALSFFFLLYFNRLFASIVSYGIRTWSWHKHKIWIDIGAIQISLLGGRIFFHGLRYHGSNETFLVQHGYVTWRYWLRRVREVDVVADSPQESAVPGRDKNAKRPCRISVNLIGVEWFVYNRSPAYDSVLAGLSDSKPDHPGLQPADVFAPEAKDDSNPSLRSRRSHRDPSELTREPNGAKNETRDSEKHSLDDSSSPESRDGASSRSGSALEDDVVRRRSDLPFLVQLLPINIYCQKAAAVIGNENTKGILTFKSDYLTADIDASETQTVDPYRQVFKIDFEHPVIELKDNEDFKSDQAGRATGNQLPVQTAAKATLFRRRYRKTVIFLRKMLHRARPFNPMQVNSGPSQGAPSSRIPGDGQWQGLSRYLDDQENDDKARWSSIEYAAENTILDSPAASLTVYWDAVTKVAPHHMSHDFRTDMNGGEAPAWGMDFSIKGGSVSYGPWADRRRADLQRVFFPSLCKDASAATPIPAGSWRAPTQFKVLIELEDTVTVKVPFREQSKNWRWRGQDTHMKPKLGAGRKRRGRAAKDGKGEAGPQRPAAWLEAKVFANSTIAYDMDMFASETGYQNLLNIDLSGSELRSVVNQRILWKSGPQRMSCDLSNPLSWNSHRLWRFNFDFDDLELYLLRDHVFLLIDLIDDWTTGPPSDYLTFVPFTYLLNLQLKNTKIFVNVNEANIIDKPGALDENSFIILSSPLLCVGTSIALDSFRPEKSSIPFDIRGDRVDLSFHLPQWSTQAAFTHSGELGQVKNLVVEGGYHYHATTSPANTDTLVLSVNGDSLYTYLYGFVVRYFLLLKDNYFGEHVHFRTLDEYQEQLQLKEQNPDAEAGTGQPSKKSNDLDVMLSIKINDPKFMLPSNLYSPKRYIQGELSSLSLDLRFTNYYMDLEVDLSPLNLSFSDSEPDVDSAGGLTSSTQLYIDGIRVFGNRLFGIPPTEPTYLCNWDVSVGKVSGECISDFIHALAGTLGALGSSFDDVENALVPYFSLVFDDVTFARVAVESINIWLHIDEAAFLLSTGTIEISSNDWARSHYSSRANINIPNIQISCVNSESAARHKTHPGRPVETQAYLHTDVHLAVVGRKLHFSQKRHTQQELVRREDQRTNRTPFLIIPEYAGEFVPEPGDPPAQGVPIPPQPLLDNGSDGSSFRSTTSATSSRRSHYLRRQTSFLSSRSSARSVRRSSSHPRTTFGLRPTDLARGSSFRDDASNSFDCRSSFYSARADGSVAESQHPTLTFFSQYYEPHFALAGAQPDTREAPQLDDDDGSSVGHEEDEFLSGYATQLEDIHPNQLSDDHAHSSTLIEFTSGVTAFIKPEAIKYAMKLVSALQPVEPEDILDSLQENCISKISSLTKKKATNGSVSDLMIRLPKARIRFLTSSFSIDGSSNIVEQEEDQYDFSISKLGLVTRTSRGHDDTSNQETVGSKTSLYLQLGSAEVSASERLSSLEKPQAAMVFRVDNVAVSVGAKEVTYFDVDIGSVIGSSASGKVEYLASLIHRTSRLATELGRLIEDTSRRHEERLKYCTYRLLKEGTSTQDPSFMIRPSAVLRSVQNHLRTYDSWKLIMRLRQIWSTMDPRSRNEFMHDISGDFPLVPEDAVDFVQEEFHRWRGWDLENIRGSFLLQRVFGPTDNPPEAPAAQDALLGACSLSELQFVLDPGPKENKVGIMEIAARIDKKIPSPDSQVLSGSQGPAPLIVLNICCDEAAVNINWELGELVDDVLRLYNRSQENAGYEVSTTAKSKGATEAAPTHQPKDPMDLHLVVEVAHGSLEVETINLKSNTVTGDFKASAIMHAGNGEAPISSNVVLNCNSVTSDLLSYTRTMSSFQLVDPTVFVAQELQESSDASIRTVKATASSRDFNFAVKEDPIGLMEVLDLLLKDEVAHVLNLVERLPAKKEQKPKHSINIKDRLSTFRFNVALFLDKYTISVPLLQSLTYKISGSVARAACAANYGREIILDFDIKENSHEMQIDVRNKPRRISLLQIPPINGRISSQMQQSEHILTILSSVEMIQLDASAVYSILGALNRPQISSALEEMKEQSRTIQRHAAEVFGTKEPPSKPSPANPADESVSEQLVYNVHLTLAGLQVSSITPLASRVEPVSQVLFSVEKMYLQSSNRHEASAPISKYPEVHVNIKQIALDIRRGTRDAMRSCGRIGAGVTVSAGVQHSDDGKDDWAFDFKSPDLDISLSPETISTALVVLAYLRGKIKDLDTSRELNYLRKLRQPKPRIVVEDSDAATSEEADILDSVLSSLVYHFQLQNIRACWNVASDGDDRSSSKEDLALSIKLIQFGTKTKKSARLTIEDFQLQTVPLGQDKTIRSLHSALLPEVIFNIAYVSTPTARRMAFQAVGQSLDLRLTSGFIMPAANLAESISLSIKNVREASTEWSLTNETTKKQEGLSNTERPWNLFGKKRLENLLIDADFAGSVVHISSKRDFSDSSRTSKINRPSLAGKYGQFNADDSGSGAVLQSPGLAWKFEFQDNGHDAPTLSGEVKIDASSNILYPSVVPLILDMVASVQEVVRVDDGTVKPAAGEDAQSNPKAGSGGPDSATPAESGDENILSTDPSAFLGGARLNLALRISRQEFSLSCQPIARVAATARFDGIYVTVNTVSSADHGNFFAVSGTFSGLQASVQHVYSRDSTGSFEIETATLSLMNSKHVSGTSGLSAILNISPMKVSVNAKQLQDFLLFREIWYPEELRRSNAAPVAKPAMENLQQAHLVQRYQQVAATAAFPWTATISVAALDVAVDLGQAIGKSVFQIHNFWVSSKKTSGWEQNLCLGFHKVGVDCSGRLSGFVALQDFRLRTSIQWPRREQALNETPMVQASLGFNALRLKAAFDYQAFLVADIRTLEFLMYNVRESRSGRGDRLVAICDSEAVQVFGTTTSASQAVALYQALKKLAQERRENLQSSLKDIEKLMRRRSSTIRHAAPPQQQRASSDASKMAGDVAGEAGAESSEVEAQTKSPISLDTDVVVTLKALNLGVFPSTFAGNQVFKVEALNAYARFAASMDTGRIHSILKMTLGQLRIGLAEVRNADGPKTLSETSVEDVVQRATGSRGGTILKVPQVSAVMETWQKPNSSAIDYVFKSAFEGKVEVGWNYSRISYIRGMWAKHRKSLEQTWGRELPMTAVRITGVPEAEGGSGGVNGGGGEGRDGGTGGRSSADARTQQGQQKITAEVNVPQSKYNYLALEPPIIETPQLRDMGEATPPLEWIGLHRDKLPNLTHQIVIVSLLELAGEVEDAYAKILGVT